VGVCLADQEDALALALDGAGDHLFGPTVRIHFGSIDQGHAKVDAQAQGVRLSGAVGATFAKVPGALAEPMVG
jgi:hypothetical protein